MWRDYNKYDAGFSAGDEISEAAVQERIEREMDMMGVWNAVEVGRQLDGQLDEVPNPAAEDNALLDELLKGECASAWRINVATTDCSDISARLGPFRRDTHADRFGKIL